MEKLIVKFNGGKLAILCSECAVILKTGNDFTETEIQYAQGKYDYVLPPQYCDKCKDNHHSKITPDELDQYVMMSQGDMDDQNLLAEIVISKMDEFNIDEVLLIGWTLNSSKNNYKYGILDDGFGFILSRLATDSDYLNIKYLHVERGAEYEHIPYCNYKEAHQRIKQQLYNILTKEQWEQLKSRLNGLKYQKQ